MSQYKEKNEKRKTFMEKSDYVMISIAKTREVYGGEGP
jgi:hypothetical protein